MQLVIYYCYLLSKLNFIELYKLRKVTNMEEIKRNIDVYKTMELADSPPEGKDEFYLWYMKKMSVLNVAEQDIGISINQERARLKKELLKLNAIEHDMVYAASQHPMYTKLYELKRERN